MSNKNVFCVTFAGPRGSSKSQIASYLSINFALPIFSNDVIRYEVMLEMSEFSQDEYMKRRNERFAKLLATNNSFILDASVDRSWDVNKIEGYEVFVISLDISKNLLLSLYKKRGFPFETSEIDKYFSDHQSFLEKHRDLVNVHITDENFKDRLEICRTELEKWLSL